MRHRLDLKARRRQPGVEVFHVGGAIAERQRARDDRARRGAADEIEMVAEPDLLAVVLGQHRLDAFQERDRDGAAHAAAVERQDPLGAGTEQVAVAVAFEGFSRLGHWPTSHRPRGPRRTGLLRSTLP